MMLRQALDIELLEDCVFSARAATEGSHESRDHIPGAALLGAAAARLYRELGGEAFAAFHSGRLRFGDGLPLAASGSVGWPVPLAWHHAKNADIRAEDGRLDRDRLFNFQHVSTLPQRDGRGQPEQLREGYVTGHGDWLKPGRDLRLKTAIDPATGRAAEGQLFGYEALHRGQRFRAFLEADDGFDAGLFRRVVAALEGEVLLGRSRSAEYGRVRITPAEADPPAPGPPRGGEITLWLLSDLAPSDDHGQPALQPAPGHFGLEGGKVVWSKTFLRARRYSPWNAARGGFDRERLVLAAGGVITLEAPADYDRDALARRLARGVGLYREAGLGRVWLDPPLLAGEHPDFAEAPAHGQEDTAAPEPAGHPLVAWLREQGLGWKTHAEEAAEALADDYIRLLQKARRIRGVPEAADFGPSRSQWGQVLTKARVRQGNALYTALFEGDDAVIKERGEGWDVEIHDGEIHDGRKLVAWLRERMAPDRIEQLAGIDEKDRGRAYAHLVRTAARRIQDEIKRRKA